MSMSTKTLEQIWQIRKNIWNVIKNMSPKEEIKYFNKTGKDLSKQLGLKYLIKDKASV